MIEDGLSYPMRGSWFGRIFIGGVLGFLSVFILPMFILLGYFVAVLEGTVEGREEPPAFENWGSLLVNGVLAWIISFVYSVVPIIAYTVILFGLLGAGSAAGGDGSVLAGLGFVSLLVFVPFMLVIYYVVPAALTNFAREGSIGAAFDFKRIAEVVLTVEYLIAVLFPLFLSVVVFVVVSVLAATIVGLLLVPFVYFYAQVAIFRLFGLAYASVEDGASVDATAGTATA